MFILSVPKHQHSVYISFWKEIRLKIKAFKAASHLIPWYLEQGSWLHGYCQFLPGDWAQQGNVENVGPLEINTLYIQSLSYKETELK